MTSQPSPHLRFEAQLVPRRLTLLAIGTVLLVVWLAIDLLLWPVGVTALVLMGLGIAQAWGRIPPL